MIEYGLFLMVYYFTLDLRQPNTPRKTEYTPMLLLWRTTG